MQIIVKRKGHKEKFDERKVYGSVYAACRSAHYNELKCEKISDDVTKKIKRYIKKKRHIASTQIRKMIVKYLIEKSNELAFFYEEHLPNLKRL